METMETFKQEQKKQQIDSQLNQNSIKEIQQAVPLQLQQEQQKNQGEQQNAIPAYVQVQIFDREQRIRDAVNGRTISAILTAQVTGADSKEMAAVKDKITICNALLNREVALSEDAEDIQEQIRILELGYLEAIAACQYYCDHRNPKFAEGKLRKKAVSDTLELLKKEMQLLPELQKLVKDERPEQEEKVKLIDLIAQAGIIQADAQAAKEQQNDRKRAVPEDPVESLTYKDFARILASDDADSLEFRGQSLRVVRNGILSKPANAISESNRKMVERFITVAIRQIEQRQELSEEQKTNMKLRLQYQLNIKFMDTQAGTVSIGKLRETMEMINRLSSDVDCALQRDKHVSPMEHRLAMAVNENLAIPTEKEVKTKAVNKRLQDILEEARKAGIKIPAVSEDDMNYIVAGRLYAIRDEVFHNMQRIYQSMSCLNGGKAADFNALAVDKKSMNCMIALSIARMTAVTSAGKAAADYQMRDYMSHVAFAHCGNPSLENEFMKTRIYGLYRDGSSGLYKQVLQQIARTGKWKNQTDRVQNGMHNLGEVCSLLKELSDMQSRAFSQGLTGEEAVQLQKISAQLQNITAQDDTVKDMKLVADNLKGTRFADGFKQLQELLGEPAAFTESARKIAEAATIREQKQDILEESPLARIQAETRKKLGITDEARHIRLEETDEILSGLQGKEKDIAAVLLQEKKPSELIKKGGDETAKNIAALYYALRSLKSGDAWSEVSVAGVKLRLAQRKNGDVELSIGNQRIPMPFNTEFLLLRLEQDISENVEKYGDRLAQDVLRDTFEHARQRILDQNIDTESTSRTLFLNVLKQKTGLDAAFFRNTSVDTLSQMAEYALSGMMDREDVEQLVKLHENSNQVMLNEKDTLEMIQVMEQNRKLHKDAEAAVIMTEKKQEETGAEQWEPEEAELMELISDMIFSKDTWKVDMEQRQPSDRLRMLMYEHSELLAKVVKKPELIGQTFQKLQLPGVDGMADAVRQQFEQLTQNDAMSKLKLLDIKNITLIFKAVLGDEQDMKNAKPAINAINTAMKLARAVGSFGSFFSGGAKKEEKEINVEEMLLEQKSSMLEIFKEMDESLNVQTKAQVEEIQKQINESVDKIFGDKKQRNRSIEDMTLVQILEQNVKGQEGQGKFFKLVLTQYFEKACTMDQRAMIASALRDAKPGQMKEGKKLSEEEKTRQMGAFLGSFLKGAGPLLHKILQGLPTEGMPDSLKIAIGDMKSRLSPIAPEIVKARMDKMIKNSKNMITKIEVQRSLGAASIGQAFLCKIYGPNLDSQGKDVVIKLLRPDVQNHLEREKDFMLECAEETSPGMLKTFQGQLHAIEQELDLRIEAKNVELGKIYNKGPKTVQSMKTVNLVNPDTNALMLEKAPGTTVDKYLEEVKEKYEKIKKEYEWTKNRDGGYSAMNQLNQLREEMAKRQSYVAELAKKWIVAGIYEEGFYHGDLHAGNIMVDDTQATVIDFGNATQITRDQQISILHMVCAAQAQNIDGFRHHFHLLLSRESEETYQQRREEFTQMLGTVLFKAGDVGARIAVALAEAQKLGLELPAPIHNFSQCQIRLKNTVDDMAAQLKEMNAQLKEMSQFKITQGDDVDPFAMIKKEVQSNIKERAESNKKESGDNIKPLETLVREKLYETRPFDEEKYRNEVEAVPTNMGRLSLLHQHLQKLKGTVSIIQAGIGQQGAARNQLMQMCKMQVNQFYDSMIRDFHTDTEEFARLKDKIVNWFDQPDNKIEELQGYINEVITVPKNEEIDNYLLRHNEVMQLIHNEPVDRKKLDEAGKQLLEEAKKLYEIEAASPCQKLQRALLSQKDTEKERLELMMKGWFEDQPNHGEELRTAYDRIQEMKNAKELLTVDSEPVKTFMELFESAMIQRAHRMEEMEQGSKREKPQLFYDVMADVIIERMKDTVDSLGFMGLYHYWWKTNTKPKPVGAAATKKRQKEEAERVLNLMVDLQMAMQNVTIKIEMAKAETDEIIQQENYRNINDYVMNNLLDSINRIPLSNEELEKTDNELQQYCNTHEIVHLYNVAEMMADIYKDKLQYTANDAYKEDDWNEILEGLR